jgi:hypothetical protein
MAAALQTARINAAVASLTASRLNARPGWIKRGSFTDLAPLDRKEVRRQMMRLVHVRPVPRI